MRLLLALLLLCFHLTGLTEPQLNYDYRPTRQEIPLTPTPNKVVVQELFWYGCPHCYDLEHQLSAWLKKNSDRIIFQRVPATPRPDWEPGARAYYTMEVLGLTTKLHDAFFDEIHKNHVLHPADEQAIVMWISKKSGLDVKKIEATYRSFAVKAKLMTSMQIFSQSSATGVPTVIVGGKYITSSTMAGGNTQMLDTLDYLVQKLAAGPAKN